MHRKDFLKTTASLVGISALTELKAFSDELEVREKKMPLLFIGHGSPMNGIEDNQFSQKWATLGKEIPLPKAVICISAHWLTNGTWVTAMPKPKTIHDFGGFPKALEEVQYPAQGSLEIAEATRKLITKTKIQLDDHEWGLDHGTWTVVRHMYPNADVPVLQLSIDFGQSPQYHYELAQELSVLRRKGVLIIGSGNMVHNLRMVRWGQNPEFGFDWAIEMNEKFKKYITEGNHKPLIHYETMGTSAKLAIPTPDHYYPLLYILGMQEKKEQATIFNDVMQMGSLTMTSVKIA
jgi:4,5-DOPA dioxygenase extradiol